MLHLCEESPIKSKRQHDCTVCGLNRKTKRDDYWGEGRKGILIIDEEIPNYYFKNLLKENNIKLERDCWIVKPLLCNNRKRVTETQLFCCQKEIEKIVKKLKPKKILTIGVSSLKMLIGPLCSGRLRFGTNKSNEKDFAYIPKVPDKWIEQKIPDQYYNCWIFPLENYNYLDRDKYKRDNSENIFIRSLSAAIRHTDFFYRHKYDEECIIVKTVNKAIDILKHFKKNVKLLSFDYETTGLKPQLKVNKHKIRCIGLSDGVAAYGIPIFYDNPEFMELLKSILISKRIKKYVWHMKFEKIWTECIFNCIINGWYLDGMLGAHIMDNRKGVVGLKFQTYVKLGISGYDAEIEKYLKAKTSNGVNNIYKAPLNLLLKYVAMDSHTTYKVNESLKSIIFTNDKLYNAYQLFHEGALALSDATATGININEERLLRNDLRLEKKLLIIEKEINEFEEVKKWDKEERFNFGSNQQLGHLLYNVLKYPVHKKTKKNSNSVDKEALGYFVDKPFIAKILEHSKIYKMKNTDLAGFKNEIANGLIHCNFNLALVLSMRGSSSNINFQNISKHDKEAKRNIRSLIVPRKGNMIVEIDFKGAEVHVGACLHRDKNMIKYLQDPTTDMHTDTAADLFLKNVEEIHPNERQVAKGFVFAQFYGDYWKQCAENLWKNMPDFTKGHLKKKGYPTLEKYERLVQDAENVLWDDRFLGYNRWRKKIWSDYLKNGYIEYPTGFRIYSNMNRKQVCNYPIQGPAFHCLLRGVIEVNKYLKKNQCNTKIIGQIHDSLVLDADRAEWELLKPIIRKIMLEDIRDDWKWLILPLKADIDYYYKNWYKCDYSEKF